MKTVFEFIHMSDLHLATKPYRVNFRDKMTCNDFQELHKNSIQNFKINHSFYPSSYDYQALAKSIIFIKNNIRHDFVLLTGDIATTGMQDDLEQAFNIVNGEELVVAKNLFNTSMIFLEDILLLPGNHDRYSGEVKPFRESSYSPGGILFDTIFKKYWKVKTSKVRTNIIVKDNIKIAILRVDFSLEENKKVPLTGMIGYAGTGKAYNYILSDIEKEVEEIKEGYGEIPILLANHFHPTQKGSLELRSADKFLLKMKKLNIHYIFCGHTHIQKIERTEDDTVISCAGSLCGLPGENTFMHHKLEVSIKKDQYYVKLKSDLYKKYPNGIIKKYKSYSA